MLPHERSLVKRLKDRPFALLGVNADNNREDTKKRLAKEQITEARVSIANNDFAYVWT